MYFRSFSAKRRKYVQSVTEAGFQINKLTIGSHTVPRQVLGILQPWQCISLKVVKDQEHEH